MDLLRPNSRHSSSNSSRRYVLQFIALVSLTIQSTTAFHHTIQRPGNVIIKTNNNNNHHHHYHYLTKRKNDPFNFNYTTSQQSKLHLFPTITSSLAAILPSTSTSSASTILGRGGAVAAATTTAAATTLKVSKVISLLHQNTFYVLSSILVLSSFGIILENRTTIGKALSAPLATMAMALVVANLGLIPFGSPVYDFTNRILIPLAIPLLLYDSNLRRVITDTGSLLLAFILGSLATVFSTIITYKLIPLSKYLGENGWKIGSALAARHIGGAINFVAVSETLNVDSGSIVSAAIAADNVVVAAYFALLFYLAIPGQNENDKGSSSNTTSSSGGNNLDESLSSKMNDDIGLVNGEAIDQDESMSMQSISVSVTVASCIVTLGKILTGVCLPKGTSALPLISVLTVFGATVFPKFFQSMRTTGTAIGVIFMQMFFAASGAAGSIKLVIESAPSLFVFSAIQVALHFISLVTVGRFILKMNSNELYLASNANVGGPTTAAAMATAKNWKRLVLPALLVGILGYATATPIAIALGQFLRTIV